MRDCRQDPCSGAALKTNEPPHVPAYDISRAVDENIRFCKGYNWLVVSRAVEVLMNKFEAPAK